MVATSWDAGLIVVEAPRKARSHATADQLRRYVAGLANFASLDGIYDFKAYPERGLGRSSSAIVRYTMPRAKRWIWLSKPGGEPLP